MLIGLAGVTSTGKTTMSETIRRMYGNHVNILSKISRNEIFEYAGIGSDCPHDLTKATNKQRAIFDISRVELQMKKERESFETVKTPTIIDGCTIVKVAYLIYLSAPFIVQYFGEDKLTEVVHMGLNHVNQYYNAIFYLPVTRLPFAEADHRVFKNLYIRSGQDAILQRLLTTELRTSISLHTFYSTDLNLIFDELSKLGVN